MSAQPDVRPAEEPRGAHQTQSVGSKVTKAPRRATSIVSGAGRVAYRYASATVRDSRNPDPRSCAKPAEFAQAIMSSTQAKISEFAGTAVTQIGKATSIAARKSSAIAQTTATGIWNAMGVAAAGSLESRRAFRKKCQESFEPLKTGARKVGDNADEWAQAAAAGAWGALLTLRTAAPAFSELDPAVKAKFAAAGLRGVRRPIDVAQAFFEERVPAAVRNLDEDAVRQFVKGKHAGHIRAVANAPEMMMEHSNIVWERAKDNLARGASDMRPMELMKANAINVMDAARIVAGQAIRTSATAGCIGMAFEGVVSVIENVVYVRKDQMTPRQAARRVWKDMLKKGRAAAIGGACMTVVVALGGRRVLTIAAPVLVAAGGVVYVVTGYKRIKTALDSVDEVPVVLPLEPPALSTGTA